jgi:hypothetical protein
MESEPKDTCIVFEGEDVILLACEEEWIRFFMYTSSRN